MPMNLHSCFIFTKKSHHFFFLVCDMSSVKRAQLIQLDLPSRLQRTGFFLTFLKHESNCTHPYLEMLHLEATPSHISRLFQATVLARTVTTLIFYQLLATEVVWSLFFLSLATGISCPLCLLPTCREKKEFSLSAFCRKLVVLSPTTAFQYCIKNVMLLLSLHCL